MINIAYLVTLAWLLGWSVFAVRFLSRGAVAPSVVFPLIVLTFFFGVPLGLDLFIGAPDFPTMPGLRAPVADPAASLIYCAYMLFIPPFWWMFGRVRANAPSLQARDSRRGAEHRMAARLRPILYVLIVAPIVTVLLAPEPLVYLNYAVTVRDIDLSDAFVAYNSVVALSALLSIIASALLLIERRRVRLSDVLALLPWMAIAVWVQGKRSIVAVALLFLMYAALERGRLRGWRLLPALLVMCATLFGFSTFYQSEIRYASAANVTFNYSHARLDWGRDAITKHALYAELHPEQRQILEFRGQSFLFDITAFVPRSIWENKPWPYAVYATSAVFGIPPRPVGWGITTSILDESVANLGWLGMIVGPAWIAFICRIGDTERNRFVKLFTILIASLFLVLHFAAFAPIFSTWLMLVLWSRWSRHRDRARRQRLGKVNALGAAAVPASTLR